MPPGGAPLGYGRIALANDEENIIRFLTRSTRTIRSINRDFIDYGA